MCVGGANVSRGGVGEGEGVGKKCGGVQGLGGGGGAGEWARVFGVCVGAWVRGVGEGGRIIRRPLVGRGV